MEVRHEQGSPEADCHHTHQTKEEVKEEVKVDGLNKENSKMMRSSEALLEKHVSCYEGYDHFLLDLFVLK